jgi:hypothetical protein
LKPLHLVGLAAANSKEPKYREFVEEEIDRMERLLGMIGKVVRDCISGLPDQNAWCRAAMKNLRLALPYETVDGLAHAHG